MSPDVPRRLAGSVPAVWGSVLGLALLSALNPVRLGVILLLVSRPRPMPNLLAYWLGCLAVSVPNFGFWLVLLHGTPMLESIGDSRGTSSTIRHFQVGIGIVVLSIAVLMTVRSLTGPGQQAQPPTSGATTPTLVLDSNNPNPIGRVLDRARDAATTGGSVIRRLIGRVYRAWENGSLWVAFVIGWFMGPAPDQILFVLAIVVPSAAAVGTQVAAAAAYVLVELLVVEIILVSYLVTPAKSLAMLQLLHDWAWAHRRHILIAMFALGGIALVALGMRST
jgi:hypothetical protein